MKRAQYILCLAAFGLLALIDSRNSASADTPLRVGVLSNDPISYRRGEDFDGIAIHLWREIQADSQTGPSEFVLVDREHPLDALKDGSVDAVLGVRPTAESIGQVRYSQPFISSSLAVATTPSAPSLDEYALALFTPRFGWIALSVSGILLAVGILCWLAERRRNSDQFHRSPSQGIWDGFYWAGVTMTTIGYGDKVPLTHLGKIVALLWMLAGIGVSSALTASVVSVVDSVKEAQSLGQLPGALREKKVAAVKDTAAATFLRDHRIEFEPFDSVSDAIDELKGGALDMVVGSELTLRAEISGKTVSIQSTGLRPQGYTVAVDPNSEDLLRRIDRGILKQTRQPDWQATLQRYTKSQ